MKLFQTHQYHEHVTNVTLQTIPQYCMNQSCLFQTRFQVYRPAYMYITSQVTHPSVNSDNRLNSDEFISLVNHVSVPIIMSGCDESITICKSADLFFMLLKFISNNRSRNSSYQQHIDHPTEQMENTLNH
jgi:hypothetical protein